MKKIILFFSILTIIGLFSGLSVCADTQYGDNEYSDDFYENFIYGDVTGDGEVDVLDLIRMKKYAAQTEKNLELVYDAADCDGNGKVEPALDITELRKYLIGVVEKLG